MQESKQEVTKAGLIFVENGGKFTKCYQPVYPRSGPFRPRVVSALSHFGPGLFRPGSFRPDFLRPPWLRLIGRTIIWLFDEESSDVKGLF